MMQYIITLRYLLLRVVRSQMATENRIYKADSELPVVGRRQDMRLLSPRYRYPLLLKRTTCELCYVVLHKGGTCKSSYGG